MNWAFALETVAVMAVIAVCFILAIRITSCSHPNPQAIDVHRNGGAHYVCYGCGVEVYLQPDELALPEPERLDVVRRKLDL